MKKIALLGVALTSVALILAGCTTTDSTLAKTDTAKTDAQVPPVVCGIWNDSKTEYTIDLTKITTGDSKLTANSDGSLSVLFPNDYASIMIPIPYTDADFMSKMTNMKMTVSCDKNGVKSFAWKLSTDTKTAWGNGGGATGQGQFVVGYSFMDYDQPWADTEVGLWFNGDNTSFDPLTKYKKLKAVAMCNNKSPLTPYTYTIKKIVFTAQ